MADQEKSSVMTPQGRPPQEAGRQEEAFRSLSSPEEDPPKTNSVEKGYDPDCKIYVSVIVLGDKAGYIYQSTLVHLQLGGGLPPLQALCAKDALQGRALW